MIGTSKAFAHPDWPGNRGCLHMEVFFNIIEKIKWLLPLTVKLVHEGHDRGVAETADFQQFSRLALDTFDRVYHHEHRVNSG